jgi:hypothetical protein
MTGRRHHPPECVHRGASLRQSADMTLTLPNGVTTGREYAIFACALLGECLPTFRCTDDVKQAIGETWVRTDGGDAYGLTSCHGCTQR